mgnify:FL=1
MEAIDKVSEMVKAGFPCFYIYTEDEISVEKQIRDLSESFKDFPYQVDKWTANTGDLEDFLTKASKNEKPTFYILINIHFFLEQPGIIQTIKDGIPIWKSKGHKIFFLENDKKIPPEINRDITFIEFELPNEQQLSAQVQFIQESALEAGLKIDLTQENINTLSKSALGLTTQQAQDAFSLSVARSQSLDPKIVTEVKAAEYLKTGLLELEQPMNIDSLQGYDNLKEYIYDIKDAFFGESKFNLPPPKGVLLIGPPGVGKSLASRSIASVLNLMLLKCDLGKVFGMYVGDSERNFRTLINIAERMSPIVLRIDEIEKQLSGSGGDNDGGVATKILGSLLTWMQESTSPVFRIATANQVDSLRPELLRKGRFDEIFFLDLPSKQERVDIFDFHLQSRLHDVIAPYFCPPLSDITEGWSGAEIEQIVIQSLRKIERYDSIESLQIILQDEILKTTPLSIIRKEDIDKIRNWAVQNGCRMASENKELEEKQQNLNGRRIMV